MQFTPLFNTLAVAVSLAAVPTLASAQAAYPTHAIKIIVPAPPGGAIDLIARVVGQKKAREIWYLCRQYDAKQALDMGLVNTVVPLDRLEEETLIWCREMLQHSPIALRCLKAALNADCDGQIGLLDLAGNATLLYYMSEEAQEGRNAYVEKRKPDFKKFPRLP